jgi:acetaldehyde dehydrogenase (acetylating)
MDSDLLSIQQARDLAVQAEYAQRIWAKATQEEVDRVCAAMAQAAFESAAHLGQMACEETGYGVAAHKKLKNELGSKIVWESIRDVRTVGVIKSDPASGIVDIAWPVGVVAALTPSTNPTSTVMYKVLIAVKARNGIVIAPHPSAVNCCRETAQIMAKAAEQAGAPHGLINILDQVSLPGTQALMEHKAISLILATGGSPMVRAAHSVGKPAYGVGPGNVPVYVDRSADIDQAARFITASKAFDHSTICATEQAVVADLPIATQLRQKMEAVGAYFVSPEQAKALSKLLFNANMGMNAATVGKSPQVLAAMAGFSVPEDSRILVAPLDKVGKEAPLSAEKLTTVLAWYEVDGWEAGCERCMELIRFGGKGHSLSIHALDEGVIMAFGLEKPVFRILVNTMSTLGAVGLTTGLVPSLTLGAGGIGGSITGDNVSVHHLFNVKRLAYGIHTPPMDAMVPGQPPSRPTSHEVEAVVRQVLREILNP